MVSVLTITVLTLICAISLNVVSQNGTTTTQTTSWQQAMAGAEAAVDVAMNALNKEALGQTGAWTNWLSASGSPPPTKPTGGSTATTAPTSSTTYNYCVPATMPLSGEASNAVSMWVTVDTAGMAKDSNNKQFYRIRATGQVASPGPPRVSNQKLDNDLRQISLAWNRFSGTRVTNTNGNVPVATRRVEVIAKPNSTSSIWGNADFSNYQITMSGSAFVDSFDSSSSLKSTNGLYDVTKRQSNGDLATLHTVSADGKTSSNLSGTAVYGDLTYSGAPVKNIGGVKGGVSTPYTAGLPTVSDPSWSSIDQSYTGGNSTPTSLIAPGNNGSGNTGSSASNAYKVKINGDLTVPSGKSITVQPHNGPSGYTAPQANPSTYVEIWITGNFTTSGSGYIKQDPDVHVTYYIDGNITVSGSSFSNQYGLAQNCQIVAIGSGSVTISGGGNFIGTLEAPGKNVTVSGGAQISGAVVSNSLNISGSGSIHFDEALKNYASGGAVLNGTYSYASWFEDNSDSIRGVIY